MPDYIHQLKQWPDFRWDDSQIASLLAEVSSRQGKLLGRMESIGFSLQEQASLDTLTTDVVRSSEIEGEILNPGEVRSSIARRLGMEVGGKVPSGRDVDGVVEMMVNATQHYNEPLSQDRLYGWHAALFPTGRSGMNKIVVGAWRDNPDNDPMQVISGMMGREKVHFQAPSAALLSDEMFAFLKWFNEAGDMNPILKAAISHLWFITIHPFDDGNGRIARAITDMQLARADHTHLRFYSMSAEIRNSRKRYYDVLEQTQKGDLDITAWLRWFLECLDRALIATGETLRLIMRKAAFWDKYGSAGLNDRQLLMLNKILDGYQGQITASNWAKLTNVSADTAGRDINALLKLAILAKGPAGGRSTSYKLLPV
jgi:Fic family protein